VLAEFRRLGAEVVHADFGRLCVQLVDGLD